MKKPDKSNTSLGNQQISKNLYSIFRHIAYVYKITIELCEVPII